MSSNQESTANSGDDQLYGSPTEILEVIHLVKESLIRMISATGADPAKTRQTARMLEVDHNYVWPATRINNTDDILVVAEHIPTTKRIEVLCQACLKFGASEADITAMREAMAKFEHLVKVSAGDRESFSDLALGLTYEDVTSRQEATRKAAFRAQSSLWGVQARVNFKTAIHSPVADNPKRFHCVRLGGLVGLKRLRPIPWSVYRMAVYNEKGDLEEQTSTPLDPELGDSLELPLLKQFCSQPLADIYSIKADQDLRFDIASGPIGNVGALDCVFGDLLPDFDSIYATEDDKLQSGMIDLQTPTEMLMFDFFVHKDLPFQVPPNVMHLDRLNAPRGYNTTSDGWNQLPLSNQVTHLPPGLSGCASTFFPQYRDLVEYAFSRLGHSAHEFDGYRFTMKYPTIPSAVVMSMPKMPPEGKS